MINKKKMKSILFILLGAITLGFSQNPPPLSSSPIGKEGGKGWCFNTTTHTISFFSYHDSNTNLELLNVTWNGESIISNTSTNANPNLVYDQHETQYIVTFNELAYEYAGPKGITLECTFLYWPPGSEEPEEITMSVTVPPCPEESSNDFGKIDLSSDILDRITVYPNPTSSTAEIALDLENNKLYELKLISQDGRLLKTFSYYNMNIENVIFKENINMSIYSNGHYYLKAITENGIITYPLIKK